MEPANFPAITITSLRVEEIEVETWHVQSYWEDMLGHRISAI